ncbi:hypothetical protein [Ligilactobacillus equi]|uniref:Uncharacterized protein n=1 Tax=Ligilactobacillus equi DSM 15833 = JCM 10991 TaxID=1423740 RepID=A0A0R1TSH3_9LACO|nr:hypothetical protein [Ligilactobacillus equi]KRL84311.1 hypothetical protein FC36_GL000234 [Ligilactobacillus equi DSM 15833 = JCM 10991]
MVLKLKDIEINDIKEGVIFNEVNCYNQIDNRNTWELSNLYPAFWDKMVSLREKDPDKELYGKLSLIEVDNNLKIVNSYSRLNKELHYVNKRQKAELDCLADNIIKIDKWAKQKNLTVYLPYQIRENRMDDEWEELLDKIKFTDCVIYE